MRASVLPRPLPLLALAALASGACGSRGDAEPDLAPARLAVPGVEIGRSCEYIDLPTELPSFGDLTVVGTPGNLDLWGYGGDPADSAVVSVRYGEDSELDWVRTVGTSLPQVRRVELERLLRGALYPRIAEAWGVRLRVSGDGHRVQVLPSVTCEPRLRRFPPYQTPGFSRAEWRLVRGQRVYVLVSLDTDGRVLDAELVHTSGSRYVDRYILDLTMAADFLPRLHDGFGVPTLYRLPLRIPRR